MSTCHVGRGCSRWLCAASLSVLALTASCGGEGAPYFIPGSAELSACTDPPAFDLQGTRWFDSGTVTILSDGCGVTANTALGACSLQWAITQTGNDVEIIVDNEYRIEGRLCGARLELRGGWWLPVQDAGACTYEDDSADEVGIQARGSTLTVTDMAMTGTLTVRGRCEAQYEIRLDKSG